MFGDKLQHLRMTKRLSQKQLADILNLDKSTISCYESNSRLPSMDVLVSIARFFHVSTDYLLDNERGRTLDVSNLSDSEVSVLELLVNLLESTNKQTT